MADGQIDELITAAIFEEHGWPGRAEGARENLLLQARRLVALRFGGALPASTGIAGVSTTGNKKLRLLDRWLVGEKIEFSGRGFSRPAALYTQLRALLTGLGMPPAEADRLIQETVAEGI